MSARHRRSGQSYLDVPNVREAIDRAASVAGDVFRSYVVDNIGWELGDNPVESPIEAIFYVWWFALKEANRQTCGSWYDLELASQREVHLPSGALYRLDFAVVPEDVERLFDAEKRGIGFPRIGVELDGHDFHERTPEQVEHRNRRDRDLHAAGWHLFHFSGREVVRKGDACAREVLEYSRRALERWWFASDPHSTGETT